MVIKENDIINGDSIELLKYIENNSIDLIIIDPPYFISRESRFENMHKDTPDIVFNKYKKMSNDFGEWDKGEIDWNPFFKEFYRILRKGGTIIIFYDIWKSNQIKEAATLNKFKQPRVGSWIKNNPVPINSGINYLSNAVEYFFTFVKSGSPTFNSKYDKGLYNFPLCHGNERYDHPTQKPLELIKELINKHSNVGDIVFDCFAGTGTTGHAAKLLDRKFILIEKDETYFNIINNRLNNI